MTTAVNPPTGTSSGDPMSTDASSTDTTTNELPPPTTAPEDPPAGRTPPAGTTPPAPPAPPSGDTPHRPRRGAWHIIGIIVGVLGLLPGFGMLAGGTTLLIANAAADDGYFDVTIDRLHADGVAIATFDLWNQADDSEDWPWALEFLDLDVRFRVEGADATDDVFVGVARRADVEEYLSGAAYAELFDLDNRSPLYDTVDGDLQVTAPAGQDFWTVSQVGPGEQELDWEARAGQWSVVIMNADGSADVTADVDVGVHSGAIVPIGITLLVVGGVVFLGSIALIVIGARGRRDH